MKIINEIFESYGYDLNENIENKINSIDFISIIVNIEEELGIEIPDQFLNYSVLNDNKLINLIESLLEIKTIV